MDALIGSTGFVGGTLARQHGFAAAFNSQTIDQARGGAFDTVVCAAAPGSMFEANRFPDRDRARIDNLIDHLSTLKAETFVLVSTIAVLAEGGLEADETADRFETEKAYGRHRRDLEVFCANHFPRCLIVRAPALFGSGLKKNFLFDILNPTPSMLNAARLAELQAALPAGVSQSLARFYAWDEALDLFVLDRPAFDATGERRACEAAIIKAGMPAAVFTNPASTFQYYGVSQLWADIGRGRARGLEVLHLAPAPLQAGALFTTLTGQAPPASPAPVHQEDMRTLHADLWGRTGPYISDPPEILAALKAFHESARAPA
ncbi:MAG: hypothetical protein Q7S93_11250 [Phenylobacterium sp.]|uniref:hypothetical protein n=1 Tax=Phenylobacterium sp. TaxID=1871053 RepID=UPI0027208E73|nr:hypothetical protein [Phenylobacterium sp.]MDO8410621.1 hypothetical protein [Phenylobacterium sp.]